MRWKRKILTETEKEILRNLYIYLFSLYVCVSAIDLYTQQQPSDERKVASSHFPFFIHNLYGRRVYREKGGGANCVKVATKDVSLLSSQIAKILFVYIFYFDFR